MAAPGCPRAPGGRCGDARSADTRGAARSRRAVPGLLERSAVPRRALTDHRRPRRALPFPPRCTWLPALPAHPRRSRQRRSLLTLPIPRSCAAGLPQSPITPPASGSAPTAALHKTPRVSGSLRSPSGITRRQEPTATAGCSNPAPRAPFLFPRLPNPTWRPHRTVPEERGRLAAGGGPAARCARISPPPRRPAPSPARTARGSYGRRNAEPGPRGERSARRQPRSYGTFPLGPNLPSLAGAINLHPRTAHAGARRLASPFPPLAPTRAP